LYTMLPSPHGALEIGGCGNFKFWDYP